MEFFIPFLHKEITLAIFNHLTVKCAGERYLNATFAAQRLITKVDATVIC